MRGSVSGDSNAWRRQWEGSSDRAELGRAVCGGILDHAGRMSGDKDTERWLRH